MYLATHTPGNCIYILRDGVCSVFIIDSCFQDPSLNKNRVICLGVGYEGLRGRDVFFDIRFKERERIVISSNYKVIAKK